MFARLFYWESRQVKICKFIDSISREDLDINKVYLRDIPRDDNYLFGSEIQKNQADGNRYYHLYFRDYEPEGHPNEYILSDKITKCILEVNKNGQLTFLGNDFKPIQTTVGFFFGTGHEGTGLSLASKNAIEYAENDKKLSQTINIVTGCIGVAALTVTAIQAFKKR